MMKKMKLVNGRKINMKITLKDGSVKEYDSAKSVYEIAEDLSEGQIGRAHV